MRLMRLINNLSIQRKFVLLYVVCVLLPLIVIQAYVLTFTMSEVRERERKNAQMAIERVHASVQNQVSATISLANALAADSLLTRQIGRHYDDPDVYYAQYYTEIRPKLARYQTAYIFQISNIEIYTDNDTVLSGGHVMRHDTMEGKPWYESFTPPASVVAYPRYQVTSGTTRVQMSVLRALDTALLKLDLNMDTIHRALYQEREYLHILLLDPKDQVASHSESMTLLAHAAESMALPEAFDSVIVFGESTPMAGWRLVASIKQETLAASLRNTVWLSLSMALATGALAAVVASLIARSFTRRSKALLANMDDVAAGQFNRIEGDMGSDEIGVLVHHYNDMTARLSSLIDDVYVLELQKKNLDVERLRAELKYLQAQVDPHFLFNTLNAVLVVCMKNHYDEVTPTLRSLAKLLRRMADASEDLTPLASEIDFVRMYLQIMRFRFGDRLRFSIDAQSEAEGWLVPKFCIQTLVENACKHSMEALTEGGIVKVTAQIASDTLHICVQDDGAGMSPDQLAQLQDGLAGRAAPLPGVGLINVVRRLALYYGDRASLSIESAPGEGTTVWLHVPRTGEEASYVPGSIGG